MLLNFDIILDYLLKKVHICVKFNLSFIMAEQTKLSSLIDNSEADENSTVQKSSLNFYEAWYRSFKLHTSCKLPEAEIIFQNILRSLQTIKHLDYKTKQFFLDDLNQLNNLINCQEDKKDKLLQDLQQANNSKFTTSQNQRREIQALKDKNQLALETKEKDHILDKEKLHIQIEKLKQVLEETENNNLLEKTKAHTQIVTLQRTLEDREKDHNMDKDSMQIQIMTLQKTLDSTTFNYEESLNQAKQELALIKDSIQTSAKTQQQYDLLQSELQETSRIFQEKLDLAQLELSEANEKLHQVSPVAYSHSFEKPFTNSSFNESYQLKYLSDNLNNTNDNSHVVLVYPKPHQIINNLLHLIESNINPSTLGIEASGIRSIKRGGILMKCSNLENVTKLKNSLESKFNNLNIIIPKKRKPRLLLHNVPIKTSKEEITFSIVNQNSHIKNFLDSVEVVRPMDDLVSVVFSIPSKITGRQHWVVEVEPQIFNITQKTGNKLHINWECLKTTEFLQVPRCSLCSRIGHTRKFCSEKTAICSNCSGNHSYRICQSSTQNCINCINNNEKFKTSFNVHHNSFDSCCPSFKVALDRLRERIAYV